MYPLGSSCQLVFASADDALDKVFLNVLKWHCNNFHKKLSATYHCRRIAQSRDMVQGNANGKLKYFQFDLDNFSQAN